MKIAIVILVLALIAVSIRLELKNVNLEKQVAAVSDTLAGQRLQQQAMQDAAIRNFFNLTGEWPLRKKTDVTEVHRIVANYDDGFFMLQCEQEKDGRVKAVLKKAKIKNPITQQQESAVFTRDSLLFELKPADFQLFKERMVGLVFTDETIENDIMCCFGGGTIDWEAIPADGQRHHFRTFCRQSLRFAEACESLLLLTNDPQLKKILARNAH